MVGDFRSGGKANIDASKPDCALERLLTMDIETVVSVEDAASDIQLSEFDHWIDAERTYVNVNTLYRDFSGDTEAPDVLALFAGMSRSRARRDASASRS